MGAMRRILPRALTALALGLAGGALLGGCGSSSTKTVSVAETQPAAQATAATTQSTATATTPSTTTTTTAPAPAPAPTSTAGGTSAPTSTRSAPEPAFTEGSTRAEGVSEAAAALRSRGYTPNDTAEYHPGQALRVLVGTRTGSGDGYGQQVFFFVNGRYIGTDAKEPSATVKVVSQSDTEVTVVYPLYRKNDALCCPGGGQATVHFQLNNGRLTPLEPIPPASSKAGLSRY
jgi:hypothetical protein